jgi:hypothetical protein
MDDGLAHLSPDEVRRALDRLRPADIVRLSLLAKHWAGGLARRDADDLLNEAFDRVLSGRRPWPSAVPTPAFFNEVMRSIASQWRHEDAREILIEDDENGATSEIEGGLGIDHEFNDLISRMRHALDGDKRSCPAKASLRGRPPATDQETEIAPDPRARRSAGTEDGGQRDPALDLEFAR